MRKQTRLLAVLSAAAVMSMTPAIMNVMNTGIVYAADYGWTEENGSLVYYDEDGYRTTDSWRKNGEDWYYLNEEGYVTTEQKVEEYYVGKDGKMVKDTWVQIKNEEEMDSPEAPDAYWYYFDKNGKSASAKWLNQNGKWYYFNAEGHMMTGKTEIDGATYYLGAENDGTMKTGWIKLEENASNPEASDAWYYFNSNGKMVENQVDKKIDGNYYTFINGKMQTGWVELPKEQSGTSLSAETDSNAEAPKATIADYQYYGAENDGKRAEGWRTIEGIDGIHDMDETFTFYFKNGKPHFASKGIELFTISSKKYGFNERGEMQKGIQVVNIGNDEIAHFYFGEDGAMKTGKQNIYNENTGETESWFFYTDGEKKGQGFHGVRDNILYIYGKRQEANSDLRYEAAELGNVSYLVNASGLIQKASSSSTSSVKPELGRGFKDYKDSNGKIWVVDVNGIIQK